MNRSESNLRSDLRAAHVIIRNALGVMTFEQKNRWSSANDRDGVIREGTTRASERQAAIDGGDAIAMREELAHANRIIVNATAVLTHHQRELWVRENWRDGVTRSLEPATCTHEDLCSLLGRLGSTA